MEPQSSTSDQVSSVSQTTRSCAWYSPLCRPSTFSRVAIAVIVAALPFVGGYFGYQLAQMSSLNEAAYIESAVLPPVATSIQTPVSPMLNATTTLKSFFDRKPDWSKTVMEYTEGGAVRVGEPGDCVVPGSGTDQPWGEGCDGRYISEKYEIVSHYRSCGGCEINYLQERLNPVSATKLDSFSNFAGEVFDKSTLTPYLIGFTQDKLVTLNLETGIEQVIYEAQPNETLLICEHGCGILADSEVVVVREGGLLYLDLLVFDENPWDDSPSGPVGSMRRFELPAS